MSCGLPALDRPPRHTCTPPWPGPPAPCSVFTLDVPLVGRLAQAAIVIARASAPDAASQARRSLRLLSTAAACWPRRAPRNRQIPRRCDRPGCGSRPRRAPAAAASPASSAPTARGSVSRNDRTAGRLAPGLEPAAVQPGVLQSDGEAESGAAGRPGPGRICPPEPVEDQVLLARREAQRRSRVPTTATASRSAAEVTITSLPSPCSTALHEQVAQDPLDPAPVHLDQARLGGQPELDPRAAPLGELLGYVGRLAYHVTDVAWARRPASPRWRRTC